MNETVDPHSLDAAAPAPVAAKPPPVRRYRLGRLALIVAIAAVLIAVGIKLERIGVEDTQSKAPSGPPATSVRAATAALGEMPIIINALGTVTPLASVTVKSQISGYLTSVAFKEGQMVQKGDLIAQIDDRPYRATLEQQQAQLAKDTSLHDQAIGNLARYDALNKQDSIAKQTVDDQRFLVAQDAAAMLVDQAQIDAAKLNIDYAHIVSPISGRVGLRLVDPGNYVTASDTTGLVVITQLDPISVIFTTPEDNLPRITQRFRSGAKLTAEVFDRANVHKIGAGELTTFDNIVDTTTGTFKLRATFPNPDLALFPSQFVNVRLLVDTEKDAVIVPSAAIQLGAVGSYVYLIGEDSTVSVRKVTTGAQDATRSVIASGLAAGDKVVIDGVDRLRDGAKVRVVPDAPQAGAAAGAGEGGKKHRKSSADADSSPPAGGPP
jgi:membrane fusion protein, multidrug efflux system